MSITVQCPSGHRLTANDTLAGKRVRCPKCSAVVSIPQPDVAPSEPRRAAENDALDELRLAPLDTAWNTPAEPRPTTPRPAKTSPAAGKRPSAARTANPKFSTAQLAAIAAGASGAALLLGLLGLWVFGTGGSDVADAPAGPPANPLPVATAAASEPASQEMPPAQQPAVEEPVAPAQEAPQFSLIPMEFDQRVLGFTLPGVTWGAAYDETTGHLALTHDEAGIVIYDIDELLKGNPAPVARLATSGLPTAICLKPLRDRRLFVFAHQNAPHLQLVDVESLRPIGNVALTNVKYVDFLTSSLAPTDPYIYYSTQQYGSQDTGSVGETDDRLGRVDILTGKQESHTPDTFADVAVSPDGDRVYARPDSTAHGVTCGWDDLLSYRGTADAPHRQWDRTLSPSPVYCIGETVAINHRVYNATLSVPIANLDFSPTAAFSSRPLLVGLGANDIVVGSANDYRRLAAIPLPPSWLRSDRAGDGNDVRLRPAVSPIVKSGFYTAEADDERQLALVIFSEHLLVVPLERLQIPAEPPLFVRAAFPAEVLAGKPIEIEMATGASDATFEYVPNTDWLPDEKTPLLGELPPGEASLKALELYSGVSAEQSFVILSSYKPLAGLRYPYRLRIGNEVMTVTGHDQSKLLVQRTNPVAHGFSERIAAVDAQGRVLTKAKPPPPPLGIPLGLAAGINHQQTIILLQDLSPFAGKPLPLPIQIGDERMLVTALDEFKTALVVERSAPVNHSVSSAAWLLDATISAPRVLNLPVVEGAIFRWTPSPEQVGHHVIRMRATSGSSMHEWFWEVRVER